MPPNALLSGAKLLAKIARNEASQLFSVRLNSLLCVYTKTKKITQIIGIVTQNKGDPYHGIGPRRLNLNTFVDRKPATKYTTTVAIKTAIP